MPETKNNGIFSRILVSEAALLRPKTVTEIIGREQLSVQGLRDIVQFTPEEIRLLTDSGVIRIIGEKLAVIILTQDSIELKGIIRMVILEAGETECCK